MGLFYSNKMALEKGLKLLALLLTWMEMRYYNNDVLRQKLPNVYMRPLYSLDDPYHLGED